MKTRGIVATSHDGIVTLSGLHFLPFGGADGHRCRTLQST